MLLPPRLSLPGTIYDSWLYEQSIVRLKKKYYTGSYFSQFIPVIVQVYSPMLIFIYRSSLRQNVIVHPSLGQNKILFSAHIQTSLNNKFLFIHLLADSGLYRQLILDMKRQASHPPLRRNKKIFPDNDNKINIKGCFLS